MAKRTTVQELKRMKTSLGNIIARLQVAEKEKREALESGQRGLIGPTPAEYIALIKTLQNEIAVLSAIESQLSRVKSMGEEIDQAL